jgi:hypothetical protein
MIEFHYAVQICDTASFQNKKRFCGDDRTLLSKKSITSLYESIKKVASTKANTFHSIALIKDRCSAELENFVLDFIKQNVDANIVFYNFDLPKTGIRNSIEYCYKWLDKHGKDFVYQIQDDYIFYENCIIDATDMFYKMLNEANTHAIIRTYNDPHLWAETYRNVATPRAIIMGTNDYWIQTYDIACTFFTSKSEFSKHWDMYSKFLDLIDAGSKKLEAESLNLIFTKKAVLGLMPIRSLSLHMQTELERDPYMDWKVLWESINTQT